MQARFCANYCARMSDIQVQHLIEKCICYKLNKEECMETLEKHAKIMPVVTSTGTSSSFSSSSSRWLFLFYSRVSTSALFLQAINQDSRV
jgi:hypothetical protein